LILTDVTGDTISTQTFGGEGNDMILDLVETQDGEIVITGYTEVQDDSLELWLMKLAIVPAVSVGNQLPACPFQLHQNYPNPFSGETTISYSVSQPSRIRLEIFTMDGRLLRQVFDKPHQPGEYRWKWEAVDLDPGIYFYRMQSSEGDNIRKMMLMR
jgi:hypothetical protein